MGSTVYVVSQVRADNTFAVFKSNPTPPALGPGSEFSITATYSFPKVSGENNSSFDPVIAYDSVGQVIYIAGTQDDASGQGTDLLLFSYSTQTDTLGAPTTLISASYIRDSYDVCVLQVPSSPPVAGHPFVVTSMTNPSIIWQTPTVADVTSISIVGDVLTVNASNSYSVGQQITFSALQNATFLNGVTVTVVSIGAGYFTANYVSADYVQVGYENGFATWLPGHTLVGLELTNTPVSLVSLTVLDASPFRTGNTFGAVSAYSPDGNSIEVYYESHPKQLTFADQTFNLVQAVRSLASPSGYTWSLGNVLTSFFGRYADSRLTVIPNGGSRVILQQFYSQLVHQNALVGNLLLGYFSDVGSPPSWAFHVNPGSNTLSYIQGTLSVSKNQNAYISYIAEPVYSFRGAWSPQVKTYAVNDRTRYNNVDYIVTTAISYNYQGMWVAETTYAAGAVVMVNLPTNPVSSSFYIANNLVNASTLSPNLDGVNWTALSTPNIDSRFVVAPTSWPVKTSSLDVTTFNMSDVPGFYNNLNFSWLRGSKYLLDNDSQWGFVGERAGSTTSGATYVSNYNVPPVVQLTPSGSTTILRGTSLLFSAAGTNDGDNNTIEFTWVEAPISGSITLTPNGDIATVAIPRSIGGSALSFVVGVAAVDYTGTTPLHPPMTVTNIAINNNVLTVTTTSLVALSAGESVFLYNLATSTFLNAVQVVISSTSGDTFSAPYTHADYTSADTGNAIANTQFAQCAVSLPYNAPPTITFTSSVIQAARNSIVTITPTYTGVDDPDDQTTYVWTQTSGSPVPSTDIISGTTQPYLEFMTNGVLIQGETLVWSLTVNDGVNAPATSTVTVSVAGYSFYISDTLQLSRSVWSGTLAQRNSIHTWAPLDVSAIYTNFQGIKRGSVLDGSDRYLLISPASISVYGGDSPNTSMLRKLFLPSQISGTSPYVLNSIMDAVHTEDDWTLVLDSTNKLYRYSTAPLITTDNPDTIIDLSTVSSMTFTKLFTTYSFGNVRVVVLSGAEGCLLMQLRNTDLQLQGSLALSESGGLLYGSNNVQFVRLSNVESLNTGLVLLGTIVNVVVNIISVTVSGNVVTIQANNTFTAGTIVKLANFTQAVFLNGVTATVISATSTQFVISFQTSDYPLTLEGSGATAITGGTTYETLIDLSHGQIIGTWDASKLRNQFVTTGEILFEPNDTYAGRPTAPVMHPVVNEGAVPNLPSFVNLGVSWTSDRPDLIQSYGLGVSLDGVNWTVSLVNNGFIESVTIPQPLGQTVYFRVIANAADSSSPYSNVVSIHT